MPFVEAGFGAKAQTECRNRIGDMEQVMSEPEQDLTASLNIHDAVVTIHDASAAGDPTIRGTGSRVAPSVVVTAKHVVENGRITCAEARRHGIAPVPRSHPTYQYMRDGDGIVCE